MSDAIGIGRFSAIGVDYREYLPLESISAASGPDHYAVLQHLHERLKPEVYLETGVEHGNTLRLANCFAIGIDPQPQLTQPASENMHVFSQTSDDFFAQHEVFGLTGGKPIDLAFIDGLHLFEASLKDFINIEKYSHPGTVVCVHDVVPHTARMASRDPQPDGWTGDVYGMVMALREHRPDLFSSALNIPGTGMLILSNLDPCNSVLQDRFPQIFAQHMALDYSKVHEQRDSVLGVVPYSESIVDYLVANMEISRARRGVRSSFQILRKEPRIRLGLNGLV